MLYVKEFCKAVFVGNLVGIDRIFLVRDMPCVESYLYYRNVDVSSIKELVWCWYSWVYYATPAKNGNHCAFVDIIESIVELRYYCETVFVL